MQHNKKERKEEKKERKKRKEKERKEKRKENNNRRKKSYVWQQRSFMDMLDHNSISQLMRKEVLFKGSQFELVNRQMMLGENITAHKNLYRSDNIMAFRYSINIVSIVRSSDRILPKFVIA